MTWTVYAERVGGEAIELDKWVDKNGFGSTKRTGDLCVPVSDSFKICSQVRLIQAFQGLASSDSVWEQFKKKKKNCSRSGFLLLILVLFLLLDGVSFTGRCKFLVLNFYVLWLDCSIVCLVAWKVLWIAGENLLDVFGKIYQYLFNLFFLKKKILAFWIYFNCKT